MQNTIVYLGKQITSLEKRRADYRRECKQTQYTSTLQQRQKEMLDHHVGLKAKILPALGTLDPSHHEADDRFSHIKTSISSAGSNFALGDSLDAAKKEADAVHQRRKKHKERKERLNYFRPGMKEMKERLEKHFEEQAIAQAEAKAQAEAEGKAEAGTIS